MNHNDYASRRDELINRLLNIDDEIYERAKYPGSSISCELARDEIIKEVRQDVDTLVLAVKGKRPTTNIWVKAVDAYDAHHLIVKGVSND
jgi:hypothetical protein